jgi:uncharacterized protein YqeY
MAETILERVQADTRDALRARERERVAALRLVADALQKARKEGADDEIAVLRRERKRRLEAAEAYRGGGSDERAAAEQSEAELIEAAIAETGASGPAEMGKAMGAVMPKVAGRADGKRVSAMVRERLGG